MKNTYSIKKSNISISFEANTFIKNCCQIILCEKYPRKRAVPKVMSVALIEPFDRWFLSLSKGSGTTRRNDCYTKCGGFDKLNHRNANLLDSPFRRYFLLHLFLIFKVHFPCSLYKSVYIAVFWFPTKQFLCLCACCI